MITVTVTVPSPAQVIAQGFTQLQLEKSSNQTATGTYAAVGSPVSLDPAITNYTLVDVSGSYTDWYVTVYLSGAGASNPSAPQPGYLSDLLSQTRDLLGVSTNEVTDTQMQGFGYFPAALARCRQRLATFDTLITAGGDSAALCFNALASLLASLLCQRMKLNVMDSEVFKDYRYIRNKALDWDETRKALLEQYELAISQAAGENGAFAATYLAPVKMAGPTTGGTDNSGLVPINPDPFETPLVPYVNIPPN